MTFVNMISNIEHNLVILEFIYNFKYSTKIVSTINLGSIDI